ncbi:MAG: DUF4878 domain-containing protein [Mediterranea sp.]|jgi:hypothetical protein|nr:DUF4878 domain-containing protein [Mediterranea sp.]
MKKMIYFSLLVLLPGLFAACSSAGPGEAAKKYAQYIADGQYGKFIDGIAFDENTTEEQVKEQKEMLAALLREKGKKEIDKRGGLKRIEIVSEDISADGNEAEVVLKQTYGDGTTDDEDYEMVKKDGVWKMVVRK